MDPGQWAWLARFIAECAPARSRANMLDILALALYSRQALAPMEADIRTVIPDFSYDKLDRGILHFYRDQAELASGLADAAAMEGKGLSRKMVSIDEAIHLEPALAHIASELKGATFTDSDSSGDIHAFVSGAARALSMGIPGFAPVSILFSTRAELAPSGPNKARVLLRSLDPQERLTRDIEPDAIVVCAASGTNALLSPLGASVPIYPAKGYTLTIDIPEGQEDCAPTVSLTDDEHKLVYSRLGSRLRVAGTAELSGYDATTLRPERCEALLAQTRRNFPLLDCSARSYWTGLRPLTPSNIPIMGWSKRWSNLMMCTGHGSLGWTHMAGSGALCSHMVRHGSQGTIEFMHGAGLNRLDMNRFAPKF
jgi:D-amino-acid dehydrogenase